MRQTVNTFFNKNGLNQTTNEVVPFLSDDVTADSFKRNNTSMPLYKSAEKQQK